MKHPSKAELDAYRAAKQAEGWGLSPERAPCIIYVETTDGALDGICMSSIVNPLISTALEGEAGRMYVIGFFHDPALALWAQERLREMDASVDELRAECAPLMLPRPPQPQTWVELPHDDLDSCDAGCGFFSDGQAHMDGCKVAAAWRAGVARDGPWWSSAAKDEDHDA